MITKLLANNFRSIGPGTELYIGPLTVLVGPNGAGKSNIADALRFLADCINTSLAHAVASRHGFRALRRWSAGRPNDLTLGAIVRVEGGYGFWVIRLESTRSGEDGFRVKSESAMWWAQKTVSGEIGALAARSFAADEEAEGAGLRIPSKPRVFGFTRTGTEIGSRKLGKLPAVAETSLLLPQLGDGPLAPLVNELRQIAIYSIFPNTVRAAQLPNPVRPMTSSGDNWASMLKDLDRKTWGAELVAALHRIVGDIDDYRVAQAGGYLVPEFRHGTAGRKGHERWFGAAQESDGTLRIAAMLTALFQLPPPALLGFEEPELAVHPGAIPVLFDFLKEASTRSQILITTQSPDLLDLVSIDDVRIVERREGATTVSRVEERQRELVKKHLFSTSELLHAEGLRPEGGGREEP